jgi:hypothetical protein
MPASSPSQSCLAVAWLTLCSPEDAMHRFALMRFSNGETDKTGITQPSQRRYVHYFNDLIENRVKV